MSSFTKKIAAIALFALSATTYSNVFAAADGWYGSISGGASYIPNNVNTTISGFYFNDAKYKTGFNVGAGLGYKSGPLRYEAELRYFRAALKNYRVDGALALLPTGKVQAGALLANVYYDFDNAANNFTPFVGVGLGGARVRTELNSPLMTNLVTAQTRFAYKGTAGINVNVSENVALSLAYVYLGTMGNSISGKNFQSHSANVGLNFSLDV